MLNFIKKYIRNRALSRYGKSGSAQFLNLREVHSIGFIYNIKDADFRKELAEIERFFYKKGIPFSGLAIESKKGLPDKLISPDSVKNESGSMEAAEAFEKKGYGVLLRKDINWAGIPRSCEVADFWNKEFDLFISFNDTGDFTSDYITGRVKAKFITGMKNFSGNPYTLVVEGENKTLLSYSDYLKQIFHYLDIINKNGTGQ